MKLKTDALKTKIGLMYLSFLRFLNSILKIVFPLLAVVRGPLTFEEDGLYTIHNCDFIKDERFIKSYEAAKTTQSWGGLDIRWRAYMVAWAANKCSDLEGDFVECGVNRGGSAMMAIQYVDFKNLNKTFYLLDTYKGIDERFVTQSEKEKGAPMAGRYSECYEAVVETFKDFSNVKIVRGAVPDTLPQVPSKKIAYLSIDMNNRVPEIAAAEYFWDKLVSGGVIVLDDYAWGGYHMEQKLGFDQFAADRGVEVLSLPTGQGVIFKP